MRGVIPAVVGAVLVVVACGGKTVVSNTPSWTLTLAKSGQKLDKVDLLFAIDNSASMGDKQQLLAQAVPVLVNRLLSPNCVDTTGIQCTAAADCASLGAGAQCDLSSGTGRCWVPGNGGACVDNTKQEFPPVHDLHLGIVSSSLGAGGSPDVCVATANDVTHQDDNGHLLNRTKGTPEGQIANAKPIDGSGGNFLAWLPSSNPLNAGKVIPNVTIYNDGQQTQLIADFESLVTGVQEHGCGLEAQLESWYRFLVQPDPYDSITLDGSTPPVAQLQGVDTTLLKMRHDFLRPDSLVAIVQVTDEEDSWSDPRWGDGSGWMVRTMMWPGGPGQGVGPRGTSECDAPVDPNNPTTTGPNNPDCVSCAAAGNKPVSGTPIANDPSCQSCAPPATTCPQKGWYTPQQDGLNVRYTSDMKRRYGLEPQWNVQRYIDGLTNRQVPDRNNEVHDSSKYADTIRNCDNPLFAASLPDGSDTSAATLCHLSPGPRTPDLIVYAILGGVPNELLQDANGNYKPSLGQDDWTRILGKDPSTFQLDGIDPHMIESIRPRAGLQAPATSYSLGTDPVNGREWNTLTSPAGIDLQYACTFQLPQPKDCTTPQFAGACDCVGMAATAPDGPPLCDPQVRTTQIRGKAYPTVRELRVAEGLGNQAVVTSLCAKDTNPADAALPGYGYNPAMTAIANRLQPILGDEGCLPEALSRATDGSVACHLLVLNQAQTNQAAGCTQPGLSQPETNLLLQVQQQWAASNQGVPPPVVCDLRQLLPSVDYSLPSCEGATGAPAGWCYVDGTGVVGCSQALRFSPHTSQTLTGVSLLLACPVAQ